MKLVLVSYFLILKEIISPGQIKILQAVLQSSTNLMTALLIMLKKFQRDLVPSPQPPT